MHGESNTKKRLTHVTCIHEVTGLDMGMVFLVLLMQMPENNFRIDYPSIQIPFT
jgi:hypothetical protein